jgi:hypothetical protein
LRESPRELRNIDHWEETLRTGWADLKAGRGEAAADSARQWVNNYLRQPHIKNRMRRQLAAKEAGRPRYEGTAVPTVSGERGRGPRRRATEQYQAGVSQMGQATVQGLQGQELGETQRAGVRGVAGAAQLTPNEMPLSLGQQAGYYAASAASPWVGLAETGRNLILGAPDEQLPPPRSMEEAAAQSTLMQGGMFAAPNLAALGPYVRYVQETLGPRTSVGQVATGLGIETARAHPRCRRELRSSRSSARRRSRSLRQERKRQVGC